jgi:uncharacterized protein
MSSRFVGTIENLVFTHRKHVLGLFILVTLFLAYEATQLRIDAGFEKLLPLKHPFIKTFMQYQEEFGGANRLLIAVRTKEGDIFTPEVFKVIKAVTDEVFFLPGVNRSSVRSIYTPNVRFIEIVEGGFAGGNVIPADFQPTEAGLQTVRENILKAGIVGRMVATDFSAALVSASLVEIDPTTGGRLDYIKVAEQLEEKIRHQYQSDKIDIHIIGFAKTIGDIAKGAASVMVFFGVSILIMFGLVFFFTHSVRLTLMALLCSMTVVIWDLGLLNLLGFGIDPMSILVPFLVFAIATSHSVQMVNGFSSEYQQGADGLTAARNAFRRLLIPGSVAVLTGTVGFLTILLIEIRMIRELAVTAGLGVMLIIFTNFFLLAVLLSYTPSRQAYREKLIRGMAKREGLWSAISHVTGKVPALIVIAVAVVLLILGLREAPKMQIGDLHAGVPELRPDSRYNKDAAMITSKFSIGVDILTTIVETVPDGCIEHDVMTEIDRFQYHVANVPGVQSTISLPQVSKLIYAGWNEGSPKWRVLPRNKQMMVQAVSPVESSSGLINRDCSIMPVMAFTEDHKADTILRVVKTIQDFAAASNSDRHRFRLATGNVGVMAATNEVVDATEAPILLWVYAAVILLSLVTFRSLRITLCMIIPLCLVSVLCYALMSLLSIGLKVSTLPVAALGVGIGIDYGIYIFSRMKSEMDKGASVPQAYLETLRVTGAAVLVTGLTLAIGVATWVLSALKFQADMGLLLSFMFLANMLGALLLLPSLAYFMFPARKAS